MTKAKAQACAAAIVGAGFNVTTEHDSVVDNWTVRAQAQSFAISSAQIAALVASQAVSGNVAVVEFS